MGVVFGILILPVEGRVAADDLVVLREAYC